MSARSHAWGPASKRRKAEGSQDRIAELEERIQELEEELDERADHIVGEGSSSDALLAQHVEELEQVQAKVKSLRAERSSRDKRIEALEAKLAASAAEVRRVSKQNGRLLESLQAANEAAADTADLARTVEELSKPGTGAAASNVKLAAEAFLRIEKIKAKHKYFDVNITLPDGEILVVKSHSHETADVFKAKVWTLTGIAPSQQMLKRHSESIEAFSNGQTLANFGLTQGGFMHLTEQEQELE